MNNSGVIDPFLERKKEIKYLIIGEGQTEKNYFMALNKKTNKAIKIIWIKPDQLSSYSDASSIYAISKIMFSLNFEIEKMNVKHWKTIIFLWLETIDSTAIDKIKIHIKDYIKIVESSKEMTLNELVFKHKNIFEYIDDIFDEMETEKLLTNYLRNNIVRKQDKENNIVRVIVLDLDYSESRYNEISKMIKKSKELKWRLILTNPCIELWFMLHMVKWGNVIKLELDNSYCRNRSTLMCEISSRILDSNNEFRSRVIENSKSEMWDYDRIIESSEVAFENIENSKLKTDLSDIINEYGTNMQYLVKEILFKEMR